MKMTEEEETNREEEKIRVDEQNQKQIEREKEVLKKESKYSGLNESKLGFNSVVSEYIGEFDVVLNSFSYNLFKNFKSK